MFISSVLQVISRNVDPTQGTLQLSRVRILSQDKTILLVLELSGFQSRFKTQLLKVSNGFRSSQLQSSISIPLEFEFLFLFVDIIPPQRGRGRPHSILVDENAALDSHAPLPQNDPSISLKFLVPFVPQARPSHQCVS